MQLTITKAELARAFGAVKGTVPSTATIPILNHVLLTANGHGELDVTGTNLDRETASSGKAEIAAAGRVTVSARVLGDIVRALPNDAEVKLAFDAEAQRLTLISGRSRYRLATLPAEDYPELAAEIWGFVARFRAYTLERLIGHTAFAAWDGEARDYLRGCCLWSPEGTATLRSAATDGHRLIAIEAPLPQDAPVVQPDTNFPEVNARGYRLLQPGGASVIIPRDTQLEIGRLLASAGANEEAELALSRTRVAVTFRDTVITSKLVEGTYINVDAVIPPRGGPQAVCRRSELIAALNRTLAVVSDKVRGLKLSIDGAELAVSARGTEGHEAVDGVECEATGAFSFGVQGPYLVEQLEAMRGVKVTLEQAAPGKGIRLTDDGEVSTVHVIMPMAVNF